MKKLKVIIVFIFTVFILLPDVHGLATSCPKAIRLYNQAVKIEDLMERGRLLSHALSVSCGDKKIVAKIHNNLADTYERQERLEKAIAEYQKASEVDPSLPTPYLSLGDIYTKLKKPKEASRYFEKGFLLQNYKSSKQIESSLNPTRAIRAVPKVNLYFGFDQAKLSNIAVRQIAALLGALKGSHLHRYRFGLAGHTDSLGTKEYNQGLSERRAEAVKQWLVAGGISKDRLMFVGFGEDRPIADNSNEEGRRYNRRVEIRTIGVSFLLASRSVHGLRQQKAQQLLREGERFLAEERYEEAIGLFKKALKAFEEQKFDEGIRAALNDLTLAYRFLGDWEKAEYYHRKGQ